MTLTLIPLATRLAQKLREPFATMGHVASEHSMLDDSHVAQIQLVSLSARSNRRSQWLAISQPRQTLSARVSARISSVSQLSAKLSSGAGKQLQRSSTLKFCIRLQPTGKRQS